MRVRCGRFRPLNDWMTNTSALNGNEEDNKKKERSRERGTN